MKYTGSQNPMSECFKVTCAEDKKSYTVHTHTGQAPLDFLCDLKGKKSEGLTYNFNFICEDPAIICAAHTECPDDCHNR
jgi:hypothetical protein